MFPKMLLTGVAALFLATGAAHATYADNAHVVELTCKFVFITIDRADSYISLVYGGVGTDGVEEYTIDHIDSDHLSMLPRDNTRPSHIYFSKSFTNKDGSKHHIIIYPNGQAKFDNQKCIVKP